MGYAFQGQVHSRQTLILTIKQYLAERVPECEQADVQTLLVEELRQLHEGLLAPACCVSSNRRAMAIGHDPPTRKLPGNGHCA